MRTGAERYLESRLKDPEYKQAYDTIRTQMTKVPEDTSKRTAREHIIDAMVLGSSGAIEHQEAVGQRQMVNSDVLPLDLGYGGKKEDYEALGFTFGKKVDDLFQEATLPEGWKRKGSSHSMWSYIVDERGIERVGIFYKAAFYDRSAHMHIANVGSKVGSNFVYGEASTRDDRHLEDKGLDDMWPLLTDDEKQQFIAYVEVWLANLEQSPHIYGRDTNIEMVKAKYEELKAT